MEVDADQSDIVEVASPTVDEKHCGINTLTEGDSADQLDILEVASPTEDEKHCGIHTIADQDPVVSATDLETPCGDCFMTHADNVELENFTTNCIEIEMQSTDCNSDNNLGNLADKDPASAKPFLENSSHEEICNSPMKDINAAHSCSNPNVTVQLDHSPFDNSGCSFTTEKKNDMKLGV